MTAMWPGFAGSATAIKYLKRDLPYLERVIPLARGRTACVQAGGHLGAYPKRLAQDFKTVYTFEPAPDLFALLMQNAPEANILKYQAVLGDDRRLVGLSRVRRDGKPNAHEGITHVAGDGNVPTLRIDDLGLTVCDLIYLDIEGYELFALRGAAATMEICRPVLAVEVNKSQDLAGQSSEELRATIRSMGYRFVMRLQSDEVYVPIEWPETSQVQS